MASFHVFIVLTSLAFLSLLGCTMALTLIIWNVQREIGSDAYIASSGKLKGFEIGFGAWRRLWKLQRIQCAFCKMNIVTCSLGMFSTGVFCLLGAGACKTFASVDDVYVRIAVVVIFVLGSF